jgi:CheY-like chemotaxis protein
MGHSLSRPTISYRTTASNKSRKRRILIVDDEPDITMAISIVLETNGFEVYSYNDPILALSSFKPLYYDLVILDVKMPKIDGFELYNEIRKTDNQAKICFITAADKTNYESLREPEQQFADHEETTQQYCALRKDMFLQKPISNDDLVNEINKRIRTKC